VSVKQIKEAIMDFSKDSWIRALAGAVGVGIMIVYILMGCAQMGVQVQGPNPFEPDPKCTIYQDMGIDPATSTGVIPQYIINPCAAQNIIVAVARSGAVLEAYQVEDVRAFVEQAKAYITVGKDFGGVKLWVGAQIGKLNKKFGLMFFTISDLFIVLPDTALLQPDDVTLTHASLDDMLKHVEEIAGLL
jgi:hypothetical protein